MDYISKLKVKISDTQEMKLVFTAQSKHFFFCRDVVCEFVMKQGYLPINPFRVFDYFLGDRVDRDLVRRGNNQLIRTCEELWVFGNIADGVLFEIISAIEQRKTVRFFTIGSELSDIKEISVEKITFEPEVHAAQIKKQDLIDFIKTGKVSETEDDLSGQLTIFDIQNQLQNIDSQYDSQTSDSYDVCDVAVIGLGSSGLLALKYLSEHGLKVIGIDKGSAPDKRREEVDDIAAGFGGSGLFSDGKLSFYPAGSNLWQRASEEKLKTAYTIVRDFLGEVGCKIPVWDNNWRKKYEADSNIDVKEYASIYIDQMQSKKLIENIYTENKGNLILNTRAVKVWNSDGGFAIKLSDDRVIHSKRLLIATGKLGNSLLYDLDEEIAFKHRYEFGVRLETDSENFIPNESDQVDYKLIKKIDEETELRTFCCCKDGKVLESVYDNVSDGKEKEYQVSSFNGGIAAVTAGRSNIGITIRSENSKSILIEEFKKFQREQNRFPFGVCLLSELLKIRKNGGTIIGEESDKLIGEFVKQLIRTEDSKYDTKIYLPEIEYYGKYPLFDWDTLKVSGRGVWIAGDVSGTFRGLIPSMLSGVYAAINIVKETE